MTSKGLCIFYFDPKNLNISCLASGILLLGIQKCANPEIKTSSPFNLAPVMPKQCPILFRSLARMKLMPTSVKNPSFASGIAKRVFSVAIMIGANALMPAPPPITIPSQHDICIVYIWATLQSRLNSSLKKTLLPYNVDYISKRTFTSPPAQNAFPPFPQNQAT